MKTKLLMVIVCFIVYIPTLYAQCPPVANQNTIRGTVFNDVNQNGTQGGTELGINNVSVDLYQDNNGDGIIDSGDVIVTSAISDGSGDYTLVIPQTTNSKNVADYFHSVSYIGNNGSENWFNDWQEIGESNGANAGNVRVRNNALRFGDYIIDNLNMSGDGVDRIVDLSGSSTATLAFDFYDWEHWSSGRDWSVDVQVSTDGLTYTTLDNITFTDAETRYSYDITSYISATTHIRFVGSGLRESLYNYLFFDNIDVSFTQISPAFPDYIVAIDGTTISNGFSLSTSSFQAVAFTDFGQADCDNDFGLFFCGSCIPVAEDDYAIIEQGESIAIPVLDNDTDGDNNIDNESVEVISQPNNGSVTIDDLGNIIYSPNGSFHGTDSFVYEVCDQSIPTPFCDSATVYITVNENVIDPCVQAVQEQIYYIPFSDEDLYTALDNAGASSCLSITNEVNRIISIKSPYPGSKITYDHWEDGYEVDITNPVQATTQVWGDQDITNGTSPEYDDDYIPSGGNIVLENTYNYNPRNSSIIAYDGRDKIYTSNDIALSVVAGDVDRFDIQLAKTDVYNIEKFGTTFTVPFGEELGQVFQYTGLFIRAANDGTTVNVDIDNDGNVDNTENLDEGEVMFIDGGVQSGASILSNLPVGVDLFFGGLDCFGTRQINILPGKFNSDVYYSPVPTTRSSAPAVVYFYNSLSRSINIDWSSNSNTGTVNVPAKSSSSLSLSNNSGYKFQSQLGDSFVASEVIDSDSSGQIYDWSFNLISEERLTDFTAIAWAPGTGDYSSNFNPVWVTPTANTTLYIKYDGDLEDTSASTSPCGIPYDQSMTLNALNYARIFDTFNNDNDQSGMALYTCDGTKIFAVYGQDSAIATTGVGSFTLDVGTTMQPMCLKPLIFANDDKAFGLEETPIDIEVSENDTAFLTNLDLNSITTTGLLQPQNGILTVNTNGTITYTPNSGFSGTDEFEYSICSLEFPDVCDTARVTVSISACSVNERNTIYGQVYFDLNEDQTNNDDIGISGININVFHDINLNGVVDGADQFLDQIASNHFGYYEFISPNYNATIKESFSSSNYSGGTGWSGNWQEVNDNGNPSSGDVRIQGSRRRLLVKDNTEAYRTVNLAGVTEADISFKVREYGTLESSDDVLVQICSDNSFSNCQTLFIKANDFVSKTVNGIEIESDKMTSNSTFRVKTNGYTSSSERFYIDDIQIRKAVKVDDFVLEVDLGTLSAGYLMSTDNVETVYFSQGSNGDCDQDNDFGLLRCNLTSSGLVFNCDDNGTPYDTSDDFYNVTLDPEGTRKGGSYTISGDITGSGTYGTPVSFGPYLVSSGNKQITITDSSGNCMLEDIEISVSQYSCLSLDADYTLDFDGVDDYLQGDSFMQGLGDVSLMAWVKIDPSNAGNANATIAGEGDACRIFVKDGNKLMFGLRTTAGSTNFLFGTNENYNEWHHVAGTFSNVTGKIALYVDGNLIREEIRTNLIGETLVGTNSWNGKFEVGRLSKDIGNQQYFTGNIDEVRVFDTELSADQLQQMVYQEIEDNGGNVRGSIIPKDVVDTSTDNVVSWSNLIAYYTMTDIKENKTSDFSGNNKHITLNNITTIQEQTAPMPYVTTNDGNWTEESTWLHGDVWDIEDTANNKDWSIVHIKDKITSSHSFVTKGLIIDAAKSLTVNGDNKVENSWYLELNGTLDLQDDSQLVQTENSDLVTSVNGKILRRQEGTSSVYWYNYWASPVGSTGVTTLSDNNLATNNPNNETYRVNMLKKPDDTNFEFTSAYDEIGKISTYWLYTYKNGITYYNWAFLNPNGQLPPGVGYTSKGTGVGSEQQYVFEGKPNNGTIIVPVTDTGGAGSVPAVSKTDYLLGNPYASALDIHKFIDDNVGVIDGTIQLWQQWSGTSHYLDEYDGGYAQVNKTGGTRAYQFVGLEGAHNGSQDGTKVPTRYLPVGQGFMTEIIATGNVVFNNSQRVFIKEADANGSYNNGSVFFRGNANAQNDEEQEATATDLMQTLRIEFNSVDGPATRRELLLGFSEATTDAFDYGYEAKNVEVYNDDLNLMLDEELMTIQAYSAITADKIVPMVLKASGNYNYTIKLTEIENIPEDQGIYIRDNQTGTYYDLRGEQPFEFLSESGEFTDRLELVFQSQEESLSITDQELEDITLYYATGRNKIVVLNPNHIDIKTIELYNIVGQSVYSTAGYEGAYNEYQLQNFSTGTYIIKLTTATNTIITKKIIVK